MAARTRLLIRFILLLCLFDGTGEGSILKIDLTLTDSTNNLLTELAVGDDFNLNVYVQDVRGADAAGVFAAYLDINYSSTLAVPTGSIEFGDQFPNGQRGDLSMLGLIDEAGAFANTFSNPNPTAAQLLFTLPLKAIAVGNLEFFSEPADEFLFSDILLNDSSDSFEPLDTSNVDYLSLIHI